MMHDDSQGDPTPDGVSFERTKGDRRMENKLKLEGHVRS